MGTYAMNEIFSYPGSISLIFMNFVGFYTFAIDALVMLIFSKSDPT